MKNFLFFLPVLCLLIGLGTGFTIGRNSRHLPRLSLNCGNKIIYVKNVSVGYFSENRNEVIYDDLKKFREDCSVFLYR